MLPAQSVSGYSGYDAVAPRRLAEDTFLHGEISRTEAETAISASGGVRRLEALVYRLNGQEPLSWKSEKVKMLALSHWPGKPPSGA